jgi:hypothetical protein
VNQLASAGLLTEFSALIVVILAFGFPLTDMGLGINICLLVSLVLKIINTCWCLAVNSDKKKHRGTFKLQCLFSQILAGLVMCFTIGVAKLTNDSLFFKNATQGGGGELMVCFWWWGSGR